MMRGDVALNLLPNFNGASIVRDVFCFKGKCLRDSHPGCRKQNIQRLLFALTLLNE